MQTGGGHRQEVWPSGVASEDAAGGHPRREEGTGRWQQASDDEGDWAGGNRVADETAGEEGERGWLTVEEERRACEVDDADVDDELRDLHRRQVLLPL